MKVTVLKPFGHNRVVVHPGEEIEIAAHRHQALAANGLVTPPEGEAAKPPAAAEYGVVKTGERPPRRQKITGA